MSYVFDPTGSLLANIVTAESHDVNTSQGISAFMYLNAGPFYESDLTLTYNGVAGEFRTLVLDTDYVFDLEMRGASTNASNSIYGAIRLLNPQLYGTISASYRALGGNFVINQRQIYEYLNDNAYNSNLVYRALTPVDAITYANSSELVIPITPESLAYLVSLNRVISLGVSFLQIDNGDQTSTGNTGGTGVTTPIEGGNTNAVKVTGTVQAQIANSSQFAQETTLQRVATAIEAQTNSTNYALETGGNLESIAQTTGAGTDAAYAGTGPTTIVGLLKGVYATIKGALNIRPLDSQTDSVTTVPSGTQVVSSAQLPSSVGQTNRAGSLSVALATDQQPIVVRSENGAAATSADIASVVDAVAANPTVAEILFVDDSGATAVFYIRREVRRANASTIDWLNLDGTTAAVDVAKLRPAYQNSGDATVVTRYQANTIGAGFQANDILAHVQVFRLDNGTNKLIGEVWKNLTTGVVLIAAPASNAYALYSEQVSVDTSALALASKQAALHADGGALTHITNFPSDQAVHFDSPQHVVVDNLPTTQQVSGEVTANIGTTNGLALDSSIQALITAVQSSNGGSSTTSTWVDNTGATAVYYIRRETTNGQGGTTVTWEDTDGNPATPIVANLQPYQAGAGGAVDLTRADMNQTFMYKASVAGSGYAIDDLLVNVVGLNTDVQPAVIVYSAWINSGPSVSTPTILSTAPSAGTYVEVTNPVTITSIDLPTNAAQESGGNLAAIATSIGSQSDSAYLSGNGSVVSLLKGVFSKLSGVLNIRTLSKTTDSVTIEGGNSAAVLVDGSATTQPVSVSSLPLPTGAAAENGNLSVIASTAGAQSDAAYTGTGSATLVSALKGVYAAVKGVLNIRALSSSTDSVTIEGGNGAAVKVDGSATTQPVSLASAPLPADAATESGNLATIASVTGAKADVAWGGSGDATVVSTLKAIFNKLGTALNIRSLSSATDTVKVEGGNAASVKVDGSSVTQPVSVTTLPLPSGAAQESGNLATLASSTGLTGDAEYAGTGSGTIIAVLKGVYAKLGTALNIRALSSASDSVSIQGGNSTAVKVDGSATVQPVSATALPLPTGAATETGNLAIVASQTAGINTATGSAGDAAWSGTGNGSVVGVLKAIYNRLTGTLNTRALASGIDSVTIQGGNSTAVKVDGSATTQPVSGAVTANIGTTNGLALDSSVQQLIAAVKATIEISGTVWADNTTEPSQYYVRRESIDEGTGTRTVSWENTDGTEATPLVANLVPADAEANFSTQSKIYHAKANGTGYATGDVLIHAYAIDNGQTTPRLAYSIWFNAGPSVASGTILGAAPTSGTYTEDTVPVSIQSMALPTNAAQETGGNLEAISTTAGAKSDAAYNGAGDASIVSALKGLYVALVSGLNIRALSSASDSVKVEGGNTTAVKVDGSATTQPVSAAVLPLPANAAKETGGNLAAISDSTGSVSDAAWSTGDGSVISVLKAAVNAIKGTLNIRALSSASDSITIQGGNAVAVKTDGSATTQPVSATTLPLPANAAKETGGNLDAINVATGTTADAAYTGTGTATVVALLKSLYVKLSSALNIRALTAADVVTVQGGNSTAVKVDGSAVTQPISATALPLPSGAATESGNLATIATNTGGVADVAYTGSGSGSVIAVLKGVYAAIKGTLNIRALSSGTDSVTIQGGNSTAVKTDGSATTQPISAAALPLPTGAAQESGNLATIATVQGAQADAAYAGTGNSTIVAALKGIYAKLGTALNIRALSSGTDSVTIQGGNSTAVKTDGSATTQPISAAALPLPSGAATESGNLATIASTQGTTADSAWAGTGTSTVVAALKGIYNKLGTALNIRALAAGTDSVTIQGGNSTAVKTDGSAVTQPISAAALPLPTGAAQESGGNLATVATKTTNLDTATGTTADAAWAGTGASTIIAGLKGIYTAVKGTLNIRALTSADVVTVQGGNTTAVKVDGSATTQPVSAASLPLPSGAATESGNLATIATQTSAINTAQGNGANGITMPTGGAGLMGWLSGIYNKLSNTLSVGVTTLPSLPAGSNAIGSVTVSNLPSTQAVSSTQLPTTLGQKTSANSLPVVLASDQSAINVSSSGGALALDSSIQTLINTIKATADFESTVWYDKTTDPSTYYIRRESLNEGTGSITVSWENLDGSVATPTVANLVSTKTNPDVEVVTQMYLATAGGTGYSNGDLLSNVFGLDTTTTATPTLKFNTWLNLTTGLTMASAPTNGTYTTAGGGSSSSVTVTASALPSNAAQETGGNLAAISTNTSAVSTTAGGVADAAYSGTGSGTLVSILKGVYSKLANALTVNVNSSALPSNAAQETGGNLASVATSAAAISTATGAQADAAWTGTGSATIIAALKAVYNKLAGTIAVSAASLPLPTGAATESGNLATVATKTTSIDAVQGAVADSAWSGTGNGTVVAVLKAIYGKLAATLTVNVSTLPSLPTGSNAIGSVSVSNFPGTQAVSVTSLPLPTGAATESGNLATIATATGTSGSGVTQPTGGTGMLGWLSGIYNKLNTSVAVTGTFWQATQPISAASLPLPTGAALETGGNLATTATQATNLNTVTGVQADAAWSGTGNGTIVAVLKAVYNKLAGTIAVSAASLPLPTGAATETGNLATVATAQGTSASGVTQMTGGAGILGWLSGIYNKLNTSVAVTGTFWQATQPISAASLPLPTGAATESGNLATVATKATSIDTVQGAVADAAWSGTGNSTVIAALKAIYGKLAATLTVSISGTPTVSVSSLPALPAGSNAIGTVSVTSSALPTGAATESGNLATIVTNTANTVSGIGTTADAAWTGSGNSTIIAALKAIFTKLNTANALSIRALSSTTDSVTVQGGNATAVKVDGSAVTQPVSNAQLPASLGAKPSASSLSVALATDTGTMNVTTPSGTPALDATLQSVLTVLSANKTMSQTVWYDYTTIPFTYYVRRETLKTSDGSISIVWESPTGTVMSPTVANLRPIEGVGDIETVSKSFQATSAGTGYASGDTLIHLYGINTSVATPALEFSIWLNAGPSGSDGTILSTPPTAGTYQEVSASAVSVTSSALPTGAATETGNLATIATQVTAINAATGTTSDAAYTGTNTPTLVALLRSVYTNTSNTSTNIGATSAAAWTGTGNSSLNGILKAIYNKLAATIAITATSLPLPTDAATETGNLASIATSNAAINTATGAQADDAWSGTGNGTVVAVLKAMYGKLAGGVAVTGTFWQATQPVSAASLPLPTGAAQETGGNLAAIATSTSNLDADLGTTADAAYTGSGNATAIAALKGIYAKLASTIAVTLPTLIKGTQGATGVSTQDLKDAGRNVSTLFMAAAVVSTATETLQSLTGYKSGAAVTATTTPAVVTTGKTFRVTRISITYVGVATIGYVLVKLRANTAGVVAVTSPLVLTLSQGATAATAGNTTTTEHTFPDGLEFAAGTGIGITVQGFGATGTAAAVGYAQVALYGYEY